jgi:hypothetical protein
VLLQLGLADFRLHLKPVRPWDFKPQCGGNISEAGQGLGLQMFPGTKPVMDSVSINLNHYASPNSNDSYLKSARDDNWEA